MNLLHWVLICIAITPKQTLKKRMKIEVYGRPLGEGWMHLDQVALEMKRSGWVQEYFVKSICEGGAID